MKPQIKISNAAASGDIRTLKHLLKHPVNLNKYTKNGESPVHAAAKNGQNEALKLLICSNAGADLNAVDRRGDTALMLAVMHEHLTVIETLICSCVNINKCNADKCSPVHMAVKQNSLEIVKQLLASGADCNLKDRNGNFPILTAIVLDHADIFGLLLPEADINIGNRENWTVLHEMAAVGDVKTMRELIKMGANINTLNKNKVSPLHLACFNNRIAAAEALLHSNADTTIVDKHGNTAYKIAVQKKHEEIVELFTKKWKQVNETISAVEPDVQDNNDSKLYDSVGNKKDTKNKTGKNDSKISKFASKDEHDMKTEQKRVRELRKKEKESVVPVAGVTYLNAQKAQKKIVLPTGPKKSKKNKLLEATGNDSKVGKQISSQGSKLFESKEKCQDTSAKPSQLPSQSTAGSISSTDENHQKLSKIVNEFFESNNSEIQTSTKNETSSSIIRRFLRSELSSNDISENIGQCSKTVKPVSKNATDDNSVETKEIGLRTIEPRSKDDSSSNDSSPETVNMKPLLTDQLDHVEKMMNYEANKRKETRLTAAVQKNNSTVVNLLINNQVDVNESNRNGWTPLHIAVQKQNKKIARTLLLENAKVNLKNKLGHFPLSTAVIKKNKSLIKLLIKNGAKVNQLNDYGETVLHTSVRAVDADILSLLCEEGVDPDITNSRGETALYLACRNGFIEGARVLIEHKANLNAPSNNGFTPLSCAAFNGHLQTIKFMLSEGADINYNQQVALKSAVSGNHPRVAKYLLEKMDTVVGSDVLLLAAFRGNREIVRLLVKQGIDVNLKFDYGITALHRAVRGDQRRMVSLLIKLGADSSSESDIGFTPLIQAAYDGNLDMIQHLVSKGADINHRCPNGFTALHMAAKFNKIYVVELLLDLGADINAATAHGKTALHRAIKSDNKELVQYLLSRGASSPEP